MIWDRVGMKDVDKCSKQYVFYSTRNTFIAVSTNHGCHI